MVAKVLGQIQSLLWMVRNSLTLPSVRPSAMRCLMYCSGSSESNLLRLCGNAERVMESRNRITAPSRKIQTRKAQTQCQFSTMLPEVVGRQNLGLLKMFLEQNMKRSQSVALTED